jgi:hypothetical protein
MQDDSPMRSAHDRILQEAQLPHFDSQDDHEVGEDEGAGDMEAQMMTDDDAQGLMQFPISKAATRLTSTNTSAAEKAAAIEDPDGANFDDDDELTPSGGPTPTIGSPAKPASEFLRGAAPSDRRSNLSLGQLPSPSHEDLSFPSPWQVSSKPMFIQRPQEMRSALRDALAPTKRRSFSGSGDTIRKFLPSMLNVGSFMPSTSFFSSSSSGGGQKSRSRGFSFNAREMFSSAPVSSSSTPPNEFLGKLSPNEPRLDEDVLRRPLTGSSGEALHAVTQSLTTNHNSVHPRKSISPRPNVIRRVTSDDSLLYHSISRASSLGDDTRFEHQHEMINSRVKAIRDSLQDRTSFRMPSLPNMPSMPRVPSFSNAMNLAFNMSNGSLPPKSKTETDLPNDILPGSGKKRSNSIPVAALNSGLLGSTVVVPEAAIESMRAMADGPNSSILDQAIEKLTGDVVIMGGYRGSILRSAKSPHRQLWVPVKVGLNIRKVNMEVGLRPQDEERMEEHIFSSGMIQNVGPIDISRRLFKRLRESENAQNGSLRIWDYGYDWRLSPHLLSRKLIKFLEGLPSNQPGSKEPGALVIPHSLGGIITRHAVNQRPELFSGVVYAGVPQSCVNILGPLRNGDAVLLSSRVLTAQVNFTLRTSFVLLPLNGHCFIDKETKESYLVDFFNVEDWIKYRLSPCTDAPLPPKIQNSSGLVNILRVGSLTNLSGRKTSNAALKKPSPQASQTAFISPNEQQPTQPIHTRAANIMQEMEGKDRTLAPQMGSLSNPMNKFQYISTSISTTVTIPRPKAIEYLTRTLAETKQFKLELAHDPAIQVVNRYPPFACIYGKSVPTVYGAKVDGRDGIARADCYDDLAFRSGDGVCLAREAMLPAGYNVVKGGRISSNRGHVTLLGDLNAVGRALEAVMRGRAKGVGLGGLEIEHRRKSPQ